MMSRSAALALVRLAGEYHAGEQKLPPEIVEKRREIDAATRNAELFVLYVGVVDHGMVQLVVELRRELDGLYAHWAEQESVTIH